ncbi:MAG: UDP-N-acetylmuramoyl-L-alanine--D-glutamate ligase [Clostridia bacterium]|nr:UDP-N-acetylmuramoyl-L-alanine--D-glutamate ligase [Clostridia bacterium]
MSQIIEYIKDKKILILGYGREGVSTYNYIRKHLPDKKITIADKNLIKLEDENTDLICGDDYLSYLNDFDLVFKSPGIAFLESVKYSEATEITCQTDMFLRFAKPTVIGITGSKGKTTTSTLIYEMLKADGKNTCLIGNIGVPVFEKADESEDLIAVIEMSSHQLEFTKASPKVAVLVNIYEEHLDHYKDGFYGYANAKLNITRFQTENDFFIYNNEQDVGHNLNLKDAINGSIVEVGFSYAENNEFVNELWKSTEHLKGTHNRQDIAYAVAAVKCFGVSDDSIRKAVKEFSGIEHRMEFVGKFKGASYYNDSIATIPTAVMGAIKALGNVTTLIFGGLDRGIDYSDFIEYLSDCDIQNLIGLPETGHDILDDVRLRNAGINAFYAENMEEAVIMARENTPENGVCLFSPAAASYNFYKNFEEKGRHFKDLVVKYCK